jgi:hypothetical protein
MRASDGNVQCRGEVNSASVGLPARLRGIDDGASASRASSCTPLGFAPPFRMAIPITVSIPHQLGRAEARRRIDDGFAKIVQLLPGSGGARTEPWDGDSLAFSVVAMGQTVAGVINVLDTEVRMRIDLPGLLGIVASGLKDRLQKVGQVLLTKN